MNPESVRYYRLGRHALLFGLRLLQTRPGEVVLIPALICRDLLAPIHAVGAIPAFYAVDRKLRLADLPRMPNIRAVLVVNYFGFPQDLAPFREYCLHHGAALIEDNAHGFLSQDSSGMPLGERGDLGIFSLRKTFLLPDGAALSVNKPSWRSRLENQLPCREESLPLDYWALHVLSGFQRRTGIPALAVAQKAVRSIRKLRTGNDVPPPDPASEYEMPGNAAPHCRTLAMLVNMQGGAEIARRRMLYEKMHELLAKEDVEPIFDHLPEGVAPYGYPFHANGKCAERVKVISHGLGMDCSRWPDLPAAVAPAAPAHYRSVWFVNFMFTKGIQ
ncbi:MAG: DegT/DnrJ/EryC1/StrS family aminotransferase [Syntrophorhabdaceae bacterium]